MKLRGWRRRAETNRTTPLKILCVADEVDLLVYSSSIRERFGDVDLILSAGDLPDEYLGFIASMLNKPLLSVAGNHDPDDNLSHNGGVSINFAEQAKARNSLALGRLAFKIRKEAGIAVLGLPGSMLYNGGVNQYSDFAMSAKIALLLPRLLLRRAFTGRGVDIVLAHAPPKGVRDGDDLCHRGFSAFNWLIRLAAPIYFIHGHVHLYDARELREQPVDSTSVVNVYGHKVLYIPKEQNP
jgi:uncharacterized protein